MSRLDVRLSLEPTVSNRGNSKGPSLFVIIIEEGSWLVVVESSDPLALLELGSSCFDLLLGLKGRGSGSPPGLSLLHRKGMQFDSTGYTTNGGAMLKVRVSCSTLFGKQLLQNNAMQMNLFF